MDQILVVKNLTKTYSSGSIALDDVSLSIDKGEIFALLGANGAGKTTLINSICGLVQPTSGIITVDGHDAWLDYRIARSLLSLVPQEVMLDPFATVLETIKNTRGFFGKPSDENLFKQILSDLSLWDKKDSKVQELSGGMKRRVLIAKALMNEPKLLFLDEPTAGVDVELRRGMWELVNRLKDAGTTIFLTTHYLEEAEKHADRIGFIAQGKLLFVKDKQELLSEYHGKSLEEIYVELSENHNAV